MKYVEKENTCADFPKGNICSTENKYKLHINNNYLQKENLDIFFF